MDIQSGNSTLTPEEGECGAIMAPSFPGIAVTGLLADAVLNVTEAIRNAADSAIPKTLNFHPESCANHGGIQPAKSKKEQGGSGVFSGGFDTNNLLAFKRAKALARKIRRQSQRES
ncbi:hypothetical protein TNCV_298921 [Trichonephila clavipes]|nr:hypothetical protein TNCV_298921 [Trichonephila clavipes]